MKNYHKYILQPGSKKHQCPNCGQKKFVVYIDCETNLPINEKVGRCDREDNCGYHYKPKQHFADLGINNEFDYMQHKPITKPPSKSFIPLDIFSKSLQHYDQNKFITFLTKQFGIEKANKLISLYFIGSSSDCYRQETGSWEGATVFWFIDIKGKIRAGQVKLFDKAGHTAKYIDKDGDTASCTDGIHTPLKWGYKKRGEELPEWLNSYVEGKKITCFFGEHLLRDTTKTIAVVEAPKTAIIASAYLPQFTWIAVGALSYLTEGRCQVLAGRKVILYPDLSKKEPGKQTTYEKWCAKAKELAHITDFKVSPLLESKATEHEREKGLDLADFLVRIPYLEKMGETPELLPIAKPKVLDEPANATYTIDCPAEGIISSTSNNDEVIHATKVNASLNSTNNYWYNSPLQEPEPWHQEIVELQNYFTSATIPNQPIRLNACTTITNIPVFIDSHLATIQNNKGKRAYQPYLERLHQLKSILTQQPTKF